MLVIKLIIKVLYSVKFLQGETLANLAKRMPFANILPKPNSRFTKVANVSYCKFANIFLAKTHKMINSLKFCPTKILRYTVIV